MLNRDRIKSILLPNNQISGTSQRALLVFWIVLFLIIWDFSTFPFLPKPSEVFHSLQDLIVTYNLPVQLFTSFKLNVVALFWSTVISLGIAYLSTIALFRVPAATIGKLRFASMIGLSFFFYILTQSGYQLKLWILIFSVTVFFVTSMLDVVASVPRENYDLAKTLRMNDFQALWEVTILGQRDLAFDVLRQNAAMGWLMMSFVEGLSREGGGIGTLLIDRNKYLSLPAVMAIQLVILATGIAQDYSIGALKNLCCKYTASRRT